MSSSLPTLPPLASAFCAAARFWPFERGKSFLLRTLERIAPPLPEPVEIGFDGTMRLEVFWNDVAGRTTALFGEHDADLQRFLTFLYDRAEATPGRDLRFVDVGANLGLFSLRLAWRGIRCDAFEPQPGLAALLERNAARNALSSLLRVHPTALGAEEGEARLEVHDENSYEARISDGAGMGGMAVPVRRLDGILRPEEWAEVVAMKVDVEGFEIDVFNGATALFGRHRPPIVFELNTSECEKRNRPPKLFREALEACGYRHFYALDRRLYPIENGIFVSTNLVALSPEDGTLRDAFGFDSSFRPSPRPEWPVVEVEF